LQLLPVNDSATHNFAICFGCSAVFSHLAGQVSHVGFECISKFLLQRTVFHLRQEHTCTGAAGLYAREWKKGNKSLPTRTNGLQNVSWRISWQTSQVLLTENSLRESNSRVRRQAYVHFATSISSERFELHHSRRKRPSEYSLGRSST
jgi:hypothetical protein